MHIVCNIQSMSQNLNWKDQGVDKSCVSKVFEFMVADGKSHKAVSQNYGPTRRSSPWYTYRCPASCRPPCIPSLGHNVGSLRKRACKIPCTATCLLLFSSELGLDGNQILGEILTCTLYVCAETTAPLRITRAHAFDHLQHTLSVLQKHWRQNISHVGPALKKLSE